MDEKIIIEKLFIFKQKEKFGFSAWDERGLNPSDDEVCEKLENLFNDCANTLIDALESGKDNQLKNILTKGLKDFKSFDYDTEEREFICDYFFELSDIIKVDFKDNLNAWLYGSTFNLFLKAVFF